MQVGARARPLKASRVIRSFKRFNVTTAVCRHKDYGRTIESPSRPQLRSCSSTGALAPLSVPTIVKLPAGSMSCRRVHHVMVYGKGKNSVESESEPESAEELSELLEALDPMKAAAIVQPMGEVDEVEILTNQLRSAESIVAASQEELERLRQEIVDKNAIITTFERSMQLDNSDSKNDQRQPREDEMSRVEALEEQVQTLSQTSQAALENLDKMSSHARKLAKEVINMRKSLINHNATMDALVKEHEKTAESQGAELARAIAAHQDLQREMEAAKMEMEAKLATTEQLKERALEAEARLKEVEEEGKERSQLSTVLTQKLEQVEAELMRTMEAKDRAEQDLQEEVKEYKKRKMELENQNSEAQIAASGLRKKLDKIMKEQESSSKTNKETATKLYDMQQLIDKAAEEVSDKKRALSKVEAELKALQKNFDADKQKANEQLQDTIRQKTEAAASLEKQLQAVQKELSEVKDQSDKDAETVSNLRSQIVTKDTKINKLEESFAAAEKEATSLRAMVKELEAKSQATASLSSDELKTLAMAYQSGLAKLGVVDLQETTTPEEITKIIAARVESVLDEQTEMKGKFDEASASIEELQKELQESRELVAATQDHLNGAAGSAQEEERRLTEQLHRAMGELDKTKEELKAAQVELEGVAAAQKAKLEEAEARMQAGISERESSLMARDAEIAELRAQIEEANKKVEKVIADKDDVVKALTEDTVQLQKALKDSLDMAETEDASLKSLKERVADQEAAIARLELELSTALEEKAEYEAAEVIMKDELAALEKGMADQMVSMEMGRERAELEMQQMKDQMTKLSDKAGASAQDPATQMELLRTQQQLESESQRADEAQGEVQRLYEQLEVLKQEIQEANDVMAEEEKLMEEILLARNNGDGTPAKVEELLLVQKELKDEISRLKEQLKGASEYHLVTQNRNYMPDEDDDDANELITSLATEVSNLREDCIEKEQIISQMQEQLNGVWGVAKNEASLSEEEVNSILAESESRIEQLQIENESLMQLVSENQELITEMAKMQAPDAAATEIATLQEMIKILQEENESLQQMQQLGTPKDFDLSLDGPVEAAINAAVDEAIKESRTALQAAQQRASKLAIENASLKRSAMQKAEILAMSRNLLNQELTRKDKDKP